MENLLSHKPHLIGRAYETFVSGREKFGNCLRGCKWSPDGTCLATNSEDHKIRLFNMPTFDWTSLDEQNYSPELNLVSLKAFKQFSCQNKTQQKKQMFLQKGFFYLKEKK